MKTIKHALGIYISKDTFYACICSELENDNLKFSESFEFSNDKKGFNQLNRWLRKEVKDKIPMVYLMEATGVYYEKLAYHLHKIKKDVVVVLPNKSKHFMASLNLKSKTAKIDAKALSQFGVERKHKSWEPPKEIY
jgi:transposase